MIKKLTLTLGGLVLLASFTSVARADAITFSFLKSNLAVKAKGGQQQHGCVIGDQAQPEAVHQALDRAQF